MRDPMRLAVLLCFTSVACGPADRDPGVGPDAADPTGDGNSTTDTCPDDAKLVYVVDQNNTLSRFDPITRTFADLGRLSCPAAFLATPFSMSVDRDATAWVLYSSGELFKVSTETLACSPTTWSAPSGVPQFGMGFSTDTAGGSTDTLFIAGGSSPTQTTSALHRVNPQTLGASPVGTVTGWPELTGTGSAELWGFFPTTPAGGGTPRIEQIDKTTGAGLRSFTLSQLAGEPAAWAFAFFGGDFYVFLMRSNELSTTVYQVDGTTGMIEGMTPAGGRTIVGAGVSTCAPVILL
jgi:hypothetical protein